MPMLNRLMIAAVLLLQVSPALAAESGRVVAGGHVGPGA